MAAADFFHILNPNRAHRPLVERYFEARPADSYFWVERQSHPTHLETLVEWAVNEGRTRIAVWGGDGSLSRAVQKLYELKALKAVSVSLIPVGTANDLARKLEIGDWRAVADKLDRSKAIIRMLDLGVMHGAGLPERVFVNNAGFGRTARALTKERPSAWRDIGAFTEKNLTLQWSAPGGNHRTEFRRTEFRAYLGIVFNAPYFNKGMHFATDIEPDDGLLNAYFVPPRGWPSLIFKWLKARLGGGMGDGRMLRVNAAAIDVESDVELYPQADGEPILDHGVRTIHFSIHPSALRMVI